MEMKNFLKKITDFSNSVQSKRDELNKKAPVSEKFVGNTKITESKNKLGKTSTYYDFSKQAEIRKIKDEELLRAKELKKAQANEMLRRLLGVVEDKIASDKQKTVEQKVSPEQEIPVEPEIIHVQIEKI